MAQLDGARDMRGGAAWSILVIALASNVVAIASGAVDHFLLGGASPSGEASLSITGKLELENVGPIGKPGVSCSGSSVASIKPPDKVIEVSSVSGLDGRPSLECVDHSGACLGPVDLTAVELPWYLDLDLRIIAPKTILVFLAVRGKTPAFLLRCSTFIGVVEDRCEGGAIAALANGAEGVFGTLGGEVQGESPECRLSQEALARGHSLITGRSGALLSVSTE